MGLAGGTKLGPYQIVAPIGAGGMGEVYRALDTKLNRPVAVKLLLDELADSEARRRFQREAQTASSLNHPHIVTVHDAGEFEGRQYLVTEYVDGGTLKDWLGPADGSTPRSGRETLELLVGVADALSTAHDAGILHRDIKPANILITRSGYAKLADFGLAKLLEGHAPDPSPDDSTRTLTEKHTRPGMVVGTIAYMSPEQAAGKPLDARSDIFSFGVVLYQALAGRRPFEGATDLETLQLIVHSAPGPLPPDVPAPLRAIVDKALEKDPALRYQSMRDVVLDLRRLIRQSGEALPASPRPLRWRSVAALAFVALLGTFAALWFRSRQPAGSAQPQYMPLTSFADAANSPALSPDGHMLTFIRSGSTFFGRGQIYVKLLPDGEPVQLTNDSLPKFGPVFSPDGTRIAYATGMLGPESMSIDTWVVPVLGGQPPQRWLTNAEGLTWSVGGAGKPRVLFSELTGHGFQMSIVSSTESRTETRTVYAPPEIGMAHRSRLSPRGDHVIVIEMGFNSWLPCRLLPADGSSPGKPVGPAPAQCTDAGWSPDGRWMYFSADTGHGVHTWRQRFPDGKPEQVTFGVTEEEGVHVAPDGRSFVTSIGASQSTLWIHDLRGDRQITSEGYSYGPSVSPDGGKLYYLVRTGGTESFIKGGLWVTNLATGQRQRLLPDFQMQQYRVSPDGRRLLFTAVEENGRTPVWLASLDGRTEPRKLTGMDCWDAYFGAPGEVLFECQEQIAPFVFHVKEDGSSLEKMIQTPFLVSQAVSPDGRWVAAQDSSVWGALVLYPVGGGAPRRVCTGCSIPQGTDPVPPSMTWTPDGKFVYLRFETSTYAIPLQPGHLLPTLPASGFPSREAIAALPGARLISHEYVYPGPDPAIYAFVKVSTQRNIYRVPIP
jgi:serine/threonine protein kinase